MLRIVVETADVAASRFAVSPLLELALLLRTLLRAAPGSALGRRFRAGGLDLDPDLRAFVFLHGPGSGASFAAPPPASMAQSVDDDLAVLLAADRAVVEAEVGEVLRHRRPDADVAAVLAAADLQPRLAVAARRAWDAVLAPEWPRVQAVLQRDVRFRAERLVEAGWAAAVGGMHPRLGWRDGAIEIGRVPDRVEHLAGRGLQLVPSVFIGEGLAVTDEQPWQPTIVYPCRGAGLVFEQAPPPTDPLAPLLGRTRAGLLLALATPSSTTQLAALTGATVGATGDHLRVLLDAGLVTRARLGRSVVYRRTSLGDGLTAAS